MLSKSADKVIDAWRFILANKEHFLSLDEPVGDQFLRLLRRQFGCGGIDRMTVLHLSNAATSRDIPPDGGACGCRVIRCTLNDFADRYVG